MARKSNRKFYRTLSLIIFFVVAAFVLYDCISTKNAEVSPQIQTVAVQGEIPDHVEIPVCAGNKNADDHQIRNFDFYSICYRESYEQAEWSAYSLKAEQLENRVNRTDDFRPDPMITTGSADLNDYKKSGYDRGHLTPAADREFSKEAVSETFYMSNMSPQYPSFNREIWQYLEHQVREWAKKFGTVYVVSGPVLDKKAEEFESIGKNKVSIPQYYYKVILTKNGDSVMGIGFILSNTKHKDTFWDYAVSIDEVEQRTGLDFFSLLEDTTESEVERSFNLDDWKTE